MPYIVSNRQSLQYTGQNLDAVQQVVNNSDYWKSAKFTSTSDYIQWTGFEGNRIKVPVGGYLVYNIYEDYYAGMSQETYQSLYREIA